MRWLITFGFSFFIVVAFTQNNRINRVGQERLPLSLYSCYDVSFYDLEIQLHEPNRRIAGTSSISFIAREPFSRMRVDLAEQLQVAKISFNGRQLTFSRMENAIIIDMGQQIPAGAVHTVDILFGGYAPVYDPVTGVGGLSWKKDPKGQAMIFTESGFRESGLWWPHKDQLTDPADSMRFNIIFDESAKIIAPGKLERVGLLPGKFKRWVYAIHHTVSPDAIYFAVGDFIRGEDNYFNEGGGHTLYYYAHASQRPNIKQRLALVGKMIACLENYFGPYPFWDRGFYLLEPENFGPDNSLTPAEETNPPFDRDLFRLVASEWFGKSVRPEGVQDKWISEAMIGYAEALFVTYLENEATGVEYLFQRKEIKIYQKAWLLHHLRLLVDNDLLWWETLEAFVQRFQYQSVRTDDAVRFFNRKLEKDFTYFFDQYMYFDVLPVLEIAVQKKRRKLTFSYRWESPISNFEMPVDIWVHGNHERLIPNAEWQSFTKKHLSERHIRIDEESGLFEIRRKSILK